jgi:TPR repeat protein
MGNFRYQRMGIIAATVILAVGSLCQSGCSGPASQPSLSAIRLAAEQGDPIAQFNFGMAFYNGDGVKQDKREAAKWYRKAAEQGLAIAQCNLGYCYEYGDGVDKDPREAVTWYRKAAEQGSADGQFDLGVCYEQGMGVDTDQHEAVKWYRKAAEQGYAFAQGELGRCYATGLGVDKEPRQAVNWYRKAAEQGIPEAELNIGLYYANGIGVDKDPREAVKWYRMAAEQGIVDAEFDLALCYQTGVGVERDEHEAQKWFRKALVSGVAIAGQVGKQFVRLMTRPTPTPLSPKQTLLDWDDHLDATSIDDVMRTYAYSGDDQTALAKLTAEEVVAYTKLQKAVIAKWGKDAEPVVLHAGGTSTRSDDEQTDVLVEDADHVVLKFKLDTISPVPLVRVDKEWKMDFAALAAGFGDKLKDVEGSVRQITEIVDSVTKALADGKYADADHLAKDIKERVDKVP